MVLLYPWKLNFCVSQLKTKSMLEKKLLLINLRVVRVTADRSDNQQQGGQHTKERLYGVFSLETLEPFYSLSKGLCGYERKKIRTASFLFETKNT